MNEEQQKESIIFEEEEEEVETLDNDASRNQNEIQLLRIEIHNKSELLKKSQIETKDLRKKYKELLELVKENDTKTRKPLNNNKDLLKWKSVWEKVITQMTEIIPYTIPKETNPDQQRAILLELTNRLCQITKNSTETTEYKNLKCKYERNKKKLIKLKEQCNSLLDLIQLKKNQTNYANLNRYQNYNDGFDEILYDDDYEINNNNRKTKYKFGFKPIHDDIILNKFTNDKDSPLIDNQYNNDQNINRKKSSIVSKSNKTKLNEKPNNLDQSEYSTKKNKSKMHVKRVNTNQTDNNFEKKNKKDDYYYSDSSSKRKHTILSDQNTNIANPPTKANLAFSNLVIIDVKLNSEAEGQLKNSNDFSDHRNHSNKTIINENSQSHSYQSKETKKEISKHENQENDLPVDQIDSNLNEIDEILDQEISEDEAEEVLNELESMKSSSNNDNEIVTKQTSESRIIIQNQQTKENYNSTQSLGNSSESKRISKKDFINYRIKYGKNMNELIDITNKLRDQYYQVTKKYGHPEYSKENDIVRIEDPLLNH